ncbi:MAG TPA: radical SAM protein [Methylomirabilota bacterium]|nr:radical SAM protein [Methylomirabilota bacterium]
MRVLLVYSNQAEHLLPAPPVGLSYVASATRAAGHEVRFLDLLPRGDARQALGEALRAFDPEVVGLSVRNIDNVVHQRLTHHLGALARLVGLVRERSRATIVLGGPAISILGPRALERLDADFAVVGEGEVAFPALLAALRDGGGYAAIDGLCWREGGQVRATAPARLARFGASGMEAWIDWPAYEAKGGTWTIQTKRGCPMSCSYCAYPAIEGTATRRRPAAEVVDEIERVRARVGPRTFEIVDSTFNVPAEHALELCWEIVRRGLRVNLTAMGVNPRATSPELFDLMRRAGFNSMMITPEAGNDTMLRNLRKGFDMADVRRTARLARESGIASAWFFMLGGPGETRETVEETCAFVEEHLRWRRCLTIVMTGIRILPGTELARAAVEEGYLAGDRDLAEPAFYLSPLVSEAWMLDRVNRAIARCPGIVHAAEEGGPIYGRLLPRALYRLGVAPPYWRFLPWLLRLPPLPTLRRLRPAVGGARSPGAA